METKETPTTGEEPVTELETWAAEIDAASGATRLLAQSIAGGQEAIELEGAAWVLAGRLEHIADEIGKIGQLYREALFPKAGAA